MPKALAFYFVLSLLGIQSSAAIAGTIGFLGALAIERSNRR